MVFSRIFILFDLSLIAITLGAMWMEEGQRGVKSAAGRPVRGEG